MRFLFLCGREIDYTRNHVLLRAFNRIGEVDTVIESGSGKSLTLRSVRIAFRALPKIRSSRYDLIFIGFYGHLLMVTVGRLSRKPIIFDAFVSTYDTLTSDRQTIKPGSILGRIALLLDHAACNIATKVLLDTPAHENYFSSVLGVSGEKLSSLPVSCNEDVFYPRPDTLPDKTTQILSYSTYLPIHGIETILHAAEIVKNESIHFRLIGQGPLYKYANRLAEDLGLDNVTFTPPVSLDRLADEIAVADICLGGPFGISSKAARVIPGKIYQMLSMAKPVIAADSPANKELLEHGISSYLCPPGNPTALANAIIDLHHDPHLVRKIRTGGRAIYEKYCSESVVTERLQKLISEVIANNSQFADK